MTAKFGFQITVQDRTLWIFPEDVNIAEAVAKAEAAVKAAVQDEIEKLRAGDTKTLKALFDKLPTEIKGEIQNEIDRLKKQVKKEADKVKEAAKGEAQAAGETLTDDDFTAIALKNKVSLIEDQFAKSTAFAKETKARIESLQQKLNQGIIYSWTRGPGEEPISLGTFDNLLDFIDDKIIASLPELIQPKFDVSDSFDAMVSGLPEPVNGAVEALKSGAIFELDGLRFKIPGKNSNDKMQFEIAMLINLVPLDLILGPFQLNRLYSKLGNFGSSETTAALPPST